MKKFLFSLFLILVTLNLHSQTWTLQTSVTGDLNSAWAVNENVVWMCGPLGSIIKTTNGGTNWTTVNNGLSGYDFYSITATSDQMCIVGAGDGAIWRTTNGGTSWILQILTPPPMFIDVLHMFDTNNGFCLSDPPGSASFWLYYITTNGGANWTFGANSPISSASEAGWNNSYMALDTGHIWWGTNKNKIWKGGFRGPFTSSGSFTYANIYGIGFNDALNGCVAGAGPVAFTTNGGSTWTYTSFTPSGASSLKSVPYSGFMWLGTTTNIYRSTNSGANWISQSTVVNAVYGLTFVNINLGWACTATGKIYKYTDNVIGVGTNNNGVPANYSLEQNYPNPFNPTTDIRYNLPKASNVSIKLYDVLGNEVMTIVNEHQNAGSFTRLVDASNLSSGVYFYTIKAGEFSATKKMSLIK